MLSIREIATTLYNMQLSENDGRGISCVRSMVVCLMKDDLLSAMQIFSTDGDKIRNYPAIYCFVYENMGCRFHQVADCDNEHCRYEYRKMKHQQ